MTNPKQFALVCCSRLDRAREFALLEDLEEVCRVDIKRLHGLSYHMEFTELATLKAIKDILAKHEITGLDVTYSNDGETHVFNVRPWTGFARKLSTGKYQVRLPSGLLHVYGSKKEYRLDFPFRFERPLSTWGMN